MKKRAFVFAIVILSVIMTFSSVNCDNNAIIRHTEVAGSFYPLQENTLRKSVDSFVQNAEVLDLHKNRTPGVLFVPHAGYIYSGDTAGHAYRLLKGRRYDFVVVIGPSHRNLFKGFQIFNGDYYETPLGRVPVAKDRVIQLMKDNPCIVSNNSYERGEHSVEVQIPFLQHTLGNFRLIPVLAGEVSLDTARSFADSLYRIFRERSCLVVISTDLSHFHSLDQARIMDEETLRLIVNMESGKLEENILTGKNEACGCQAVLAGIEYARKWGFEKPVLLKYDTSASGGPKDTSRVVGYGALASFKKEHLDDAEKEYLIKLARRVLEGYGEGKGFVPEEPPYPSLKEFRGAFVTLKIDGDLRGCIGHIVPACELFNSVIQNTINAASRDPRFGAVKKEEIPRISIEISALTPMKPVKYEDILVGRDGVLLKYGFRQAVFLPQVPLEQGWDKKTYLEELCLKAGLPAETYRKQDVQLYAFQAEVFHESEKKDGK